MLFYVAVADPAEAEVAAAYASAANAREKALAMEQEAWIHEKREREIALREAECDRKLRELETREAAMGEIGEGVLGSSSDDSSDADYTGGVVGGLDFDYAQL